LSDLKIESVLQTIVTADAASALLAELRGESAPRSGMSGFIHNDVSIIERIPKVGMLPFWNNTPFNMRKLASGGEIVSHASRESMPTIVGKCAASYLLFVPESQACSLHLQFFFLYNEDESLAFMNMHQPWPFRTPKGP
jgi:hypothetical protein